MSYDRFEVCKVCWHLSIYLGACCWRWIRENLLKLGDSAQVNAVWKLGLPLKTRSSVHNRKESEWLFTMDSLPMWFSYGCLQMIALPLLTFPANHRILPRGTLVGNAVSGSIWTYSKCLNSHLFLLVCSMNMAEHHSGTNGEEPTHGSPKAPTPWLTAVHSRNYTMRCAEDVTSGIHLAEAH